MITDTDFTDAELRDWMAENGYYAAKRTPVGIAAVCPMTFGKGRICVGTRFTVDDSYCYESVGQAIAALAVWDPSATPEPDGWFRHPPSGRRRPDGDPSREYVWQ